MAVPFTNKLPRLPKGFQSVLKDIAREVLKNKPDNIYEFGSRYLDQCLRVRNGKYPLQQYITSNFFEWFYESFRILWNIHCKCTRNWYIKPIIYVGEDDD